MSGSIKLIKRRIKSVASTAKLTRAMQMIATVSMRKAAKQSKLAMPFAEETVSFLLRFSKYIGQNKFRHPYLEEKPLQNVLGVVITSNRGLCGNFHSQIEKKIHTIVEHPEGLLKYPFDEISEEEKSRSVKVNFEWLVIGKKGEKIVRRLKQPIIASFTQLNEKVDHSELGAVYKVIKDAFDSGKYQKVIIFYTQYVNSLKQIPMMGQLLPISEPEVRRITDEWQINLENFKPKDPQKANYLIEPDREGLIEVIVLLLLRTIIYYTVLQSKASVESARMLAMKNATDAAGEMREILTLVFNQLRQGKITQEIAEISAGRAALE